jgi:hypothetical protein
VELVGSLIASARPSLWRHPAKFMGLLKAQTNRIERLQHGFVQFPSNATAIVKQGAQSSLGCCEGRGKTVFDLFMQQARIQLIALLGDL